MKRISVGMSGTSGLLYGIRLIEALADIETKAAIGERFAAGTLLYNGDPLPEFWHRHICRTTVLAVGMRVVFRARLV